MPENALQELLRIPSDRLTPGVKEYLSRSLRLLKDAHLKDEAGTAVCASYTTVIDNLLKTLFDVISKDFPSTADTAMISVGGYGRGELNLRSDIDLMLLYRKVLTPEVEEFTKKLLYILWDTGLDLGFSIRSVDECIQLAREDIKTSTSLLDRRLLTGAPALFETLGTLVSRKLFSKRRAGAFIEEKLEENRQRHEKYGGSVYTLEPNVKEGEGGLRDLHTARWIINATRGGTTAEPFSLGLITDKDRKELAGSLDFLLWVRNDLHLNAGRKADQLTFDQQERIAELLGFESTSQNLAVEQFMHRYYRSAAEINHYSNLMLSRWLHRDRPRHIWPQKRKRIDGVFDISSGFLTVRDDAAFENAIEAPMKAFEYSQRYEIDLDQGVKDRVLAFTSGASRRDLDGFRTSPEAARSFLDILKGDDVYGTLAEMHRLKLLDTYIPEFADITCRVQHDLYHVYTVDTHTLFAVRELERLKERNRSEFPLHAMIYDEVANPEVLILGVLFHDIGKSCGKGHAEKGAEIVETICARLGLPEDDASLVRFLVRYHLILADTAQYRDLHDEKLVVEFAKKVGELDRLNLLFLLTYADVRAVGPDVWSQWKGALFQELYFKAVDVLERGTFEIEEAGPRIDRIRARVQEITGPEGIGPETVDKYFDLLPQRYFLSNQPEFIARHIAVLKGMGSRPYALNVEQDTYREYTEIVICTHDVHRLFAMITGVMAANGVDILGAQINTLRNGIALDILQVTGPAGGLLEEEHKLNKIDSDLREVLTGRVDVAEIVGKRQRPSILDTKPRPGVRTRVRINNEVSDEYTVIDVHTENRIGLLYDIASTFAELGLFIHIAKIFTKGEEAADIFYVKDIFGQKIYFNEKLDEITETLYAVLDQAVSKEVLRKK